MPQTQSWTEYQEALGARIVDRTLALVVAQGQPYTLANIQEALTVAELEEWAKLKPAN